MQWNLSSHIAVSQIHVLYHFCKLPEIIKSILSKWVSPALSVVSSVSWVFHYGLWQNMSQCLKSPPHRHASGLWRLEHSMKGIDHLRKVPPKLQWVYQYGHERTTLIIYRHRLTHFFKILSKWGSPINTQCLWKIHFSIHIMKNPFKDDTHSREIHTAGRSP